jgi:hypothetical protein
VPENEMKIFENLLWSMFHSYFIAKQRITKNVERCQSKKRELKMEIIYFTRLSHETRTGMAVISAIVVFAVRGNLESSQEARPAGLDFSRCDLESPFVSCMHCDCNMVSTVTVRNRYYASRMK